MKKLFSLILGLSLFGLPAVPSVFAGKTGPGTPAAGPSAKRHTFTAEEDEKILAFVQANGPRNWKNIAAALGTGRTIKQCRERYHHYLEVASGDKRPWNASEDQLLIEKVNKLGPAWAALRQFFSGYSAGFLRNRWNFIKGKPQAGPAAQSPVQPAQQNFPTEPVAQSPNQQNLPETNALALGACGSSDFDNFNPFPDDFGFFD